MPEVSNLFNSGVYKCIYVLRESTDQEHLLGNEIHTEVNTIAS